MNITTNHPYPPNERADAAIRAFIRQGAINMKTYTRIFVTILMIAVTSSGFLTSPVLALEEMEARQVAVNVDEREDGDNETSDMEMTLTNKRGQNRIRKVTTYRKDYGEDSKSVMFFLEPADVKGTGFLSWSYDDKNKDDDQWLYLPALKKVRRISSSGKADYFMGTDFTYSDMGDRDVDDYTYAHIDTEVIDGIECYHLERLPRDDTVIDETGYSRTEIWVRPDIWMMTKAVFFDKKGKLLKELTVSDFEEVNGIWVANTMHMNNIQKEHQTTLTFSNNQFNTDLDDDFFSQRRLTKGVR
jgi:outer membrane lipoprotein-sorting protein